MSFTPLENILRCPELPLEIREINSWKTIEEQLRTELPDDYKKFIQSFGTGTINEFLFILNPFSVNQHVNLLKRGQVEREAYMTSKANFSKYYVDDIFPILGGLLPFGITDNGEVLYWRTAGNPKHWTVTVYESRGPAHLNFETSMAEFLSGVLSGVLLCKVLPNSFMKAKPTFKAIKVNS